MLKSIIQTFLMLALCALCPVWAASTFQGPSAAVTRAQNSLSMVGRMGAVPVSIPGIPAQGRDVDVFVSFYFDSAYEVQNTRAATVTAYTTVTGVNLRGHSLGTPDVSGSVGFCNTLGSCGGTLNGYTGSPCTFTDTTHWQSHGDSHLIPSNSQIPAQYLGRFYAVNGPIALTLDSYCNMQQWETASGHPWHYQFGSGYFETDPQGFYNHRVRRYNVSWQVTVVPVQ